MKKTIFTIIAALVLTASCTSCGWEVEIVDPTESSESLAELIFGEREESEETVLLYPPTEDMLSIDATGLLRYKVLYYDPFENSKPDGSEQVVWVNKYPMIYIYEPYQCKYEVFEYRAENSEATLNRLVSETVNRLNSYIDKESFKVSVSVHKNMAVVDFYGTTESFWSYLSDEKNHNEFLNSIAMTIEKAAGYDPGFTLEGGKQFKTDFVTLKDDGYGRYEPAYLYAEISAEEYADLRASFPYDGSWKNEIPREYSFDNVLSKVYDDSVTLRPEGMDVLLFAMGGAGAFESSDEISDKTKVAVATDMLGLVAPIYGDDNSPAAKAIGEAVKDDFIPQEWVEEFIKDIFGPEAKINHISANHFTYHAETGVYTPPHRGGWADYFPYVFEVKETADGYEAEVAYIYIGMGGYGFEAGAWYEDFNYEYKHLEDDPTEMDFIENKAPRYNITFKKTPDGELYIASSEKNPVNTEAEYFAVMQKYIAPIHYLAVEKTWGDIAEVPPEYLLAAGYAWVYNHYPNAAYLNGYYGTKDTMPENPEGREFESFTLVYTDVSVERLRELPYYDAESKNYILPNNFCFGKEKYPVITFVSDYGESIEIYYDIIDSKEKVIGSRVLTVEIIDDIQWRYKSCCDTE